MSRLKDSKVNLGIDGSGDQCHRAGLASTLPAASTARTQSVLLLVGNSWPLSHGENGAGRPSASDAHSKCAPESSLSNQNVPGRGMLPVGPSVAVVSGATVSRVQIHSAGVGSRRPES